MDDYSLVPVEHQPDFGNVSLVPVDHDPFSADGVTQQAAAVPDSAEAALDLAASAARHDIKTRRPNNEEETDV